MTTRRVLVSGTAAEACAGYKSRRLSIDAENRPPKKEVVMDGATNMSLIEEKTQCESEVRTWLPRLPIMLVFLLGYILLSDKLNASSRFVVKSDGVLDASELVKHAPIPVSEEFAEVAALTAVAGEVQDMKDSIKILQDQMQVAHLNVAQKAELSKIQGVMEQLEKRIQTITQHVNEEQGPKLVALTEELRKRRDELTTMNKEKVVNLANRELGAILWAQKTTRSTHLLRFPAIVPVLQLVGHVIPRYTQTALQAEQKTAWRSLDTVIDEAPIRGYMDAGCVKDSAIVEIGVIFPYAASVHSIALEHAQESLDRMPRSRPVEVEIELFEKSHLVHRASYKNIQYNDEGVWQVGLREHDILADRIAIRAASEEAPVCIYRVRVFGQ